jgi:diguanylate cyclase (GGDEF)-like protein
MSRTNHAPPRVLWIAALAALAAHGLHSLGVLGGPAALFDVWVYSGLIGLSALVCLARGVLVRADRAAWLVLGLGLLSWTGGEVAWSAYVSGLAEPPYPSIADPFYLGFYALSYVAVILLVRARIRDFERSLWLDGAIAALGVAALGTAVLFQAVLGATDGSASAVATNLAYPLADILLIALVLCVVALTGWRPGGAWLFLGAGFAVAAVADGIYLFEAANGAYIEGTILDTLWPAATLLLAFASTRSARPAKGIHLGGRRLLVVPTTFGLVAIAVLAYDHFEAVNTLALALALVTVLAVTLRYALTFRENLAMLERIGEQAVTDALTGLGNRRRLMADLEEELATRTDALLVLVLDLDGFKAYNDAYGHPAGDALLARLGRKLAAAVPVEAVAYRLGGDEFCVLLHGESATEEVVDRLATALSDHGDAFSISSSFGAVFCPEETASATEALRIADQRLYGQKQHRRDSAGAQSHDVLLRALYEREPELHDHVRGVAELAARVGRRLALNPGDLDDLVRAAELHDIGKIAIPDAILRKPGPLDEEERRFIDQHTIIGQRIVGAAPALVRVARVVRSSHERWDGRGYPDGLAGEQIPLAARVVAVCDAYGSMTDCRPYGAAVDHSRALAELRSCAGTQFDPAVVEAFCAELGAGVVADAARVA